MRYGVTRDFVRCMEVVMPDGKIMNFSSNVGKNTTGLDLKDLVVGSEGILCVVTQITLKLVTQPTHVCSVILPFATLDESADMVPKILALPYVPTTIEFLERELIDMIERHLHKVFPVREGEAVLFVKYEASGPEELDRMVSALGEGALANGALDCIADTPERAESVWSVRRAELEGMQAEAPALEEADIVVPRSRIAEYLKASKRIGLKHGLRVEPCGHVGDGNIHTELLRSPEQTDEENRMPASFAAARIAMNAETSPLGGQMSGEHGTGSGRTEFLREFLGDDMISLYRGIKRVFDPNWILNPGKMIALMPGEDVK